MPSASTPPQDQRSRSLWALGWKRLKRDHIGFAAALVVGVFVLLALAGWSGLVASRWQSEVAKPYAPPTLFRHLGPQRTQLTAANIDAANQDQGTAALVGDEDPLAAELAQARQSSGPARAASAPLADTLSMGADLRGRSVLQKVLRGTSTSLLVGFSGSLTAILLGTLMGGLAGYFGRRIDDLLMWFYSVFTSVPDMLLLLAFSAVFRRGISTVILVMAITSWTGTFRLMRAEFMKHKGREYVKAADAIGASHLRRMFIHILPNVAYLLLVQFSILTVGLIKYEVILSFLGFGVGVTQVSWGSMLAEAPAELVQGYWWQMACVTLFMSLLVTAFSMLTDSLRDALDPKVK